MDGSTLKARIFETYAALSEVHDQWTAWYTHPFVDPDFFQAVIAVRDQVTPYVIGIYRDSVLETLVLGRIERTSLPLKVGYWSICRLSVVRLVIPQGGVLGSTSPAHCAEIIHQIEVCLSRKKCHMAMLSCAPYDSPLVAAFKDAPLFCRDYFEQSSPRWVMDVPSSVDEIYNRMSSKTRNKKRRQARLLESTFDRVETRCYENEADMERVIADADEVTRRTYQRGLGVGFSANEEARIRIGLEMRRQKFRGYFLYVDEKPIAFALGTLHRNVLFGSVTAFDPRYGKYSPGTYLFLQVFERACRSQIESIDFGVGDATYKAGFGTAMRSEVSLNFFAPSLRGIAANMIHSLVQIFDRLGRLAADKLGILRFVKKRLRLQAQSGTTE